MYSALLIVVFGWFLLNRAVYYVDPAGYADCRRAVDDVEKVRKALGY